MLDKNQPIIVKKIKKGGHGHHGGAWKVAYADFVTAMMAFFLLMWLMGSTSQEQKKSISGYFQNPSPIFGTGGSGSSFVNMGSSVDAPMMGVGKNANPLEQSQAAQLTEQAEMQKLEQIKLQLEYAIEKDPELKAFKDQLRIEMTDEGLRIQVLDKQNRPMFDLGSAIVKPYMHRILREVAKVVNAVPNMVSITGHTDARPYPGQRGYSNWELSSDRANASRRELIAGGMDPARIGRVEGLSSNALLFRDKPYDPTNRRISITVLKKKAADEIERKAVDASSPTAMEEVKQAVAPAPKPLATPDPIVAPPVKHDEASPTPPAIEPPKSVVNTQNKSTAGTPPPLFKLPPLPAVPAAK